MSHSVAEWYALIERAFAKRAGEPVRQNAAPRLKAQRAAALASLDRADVGAKPAPGLTGGKPSAGALPEMQRRGGPWLVQSVREQEVARLRSFWDRPLK